MFKGIENCVGTSVKGWGRVDVVHVDCTYLPEGSLELDIDGCGRCLSIFRKIYLGQRSWS